MPWDDLHESKEPKDSFKNRGGQGGGGQGEGPPQTPFNIHQIKILLISINNIFMQRMSKKFVLLTQHLTVI